MPSCVAYNCKNRSGSKISLHSFPFHDRKRLRQWVKNIKRRTWKPNVHSRLCEQHFTPDCYTITGRKLKPDAVPTIFDFSGPNRPSGPSAAKSADISDVSLDHNYCNEEVAANVEAVEVQYNHSEATAPNSADHHYAVMSSPKSFKRQVEKKLESCRKKLEMEKQKSRKLKQKVSTLTQVISALIHKQCIVKPRLLPSNRIPLKRSIALNKGKTVQGRLDRLQQLSKEAKLGNKNSRPHPAAPAAGPRTPVQTRATRHSRPITTPSPSQSRMPDTEPSL